MADTNNDLTDDIVEAAQGPQRVRGDQVETEMYGLTELIEADKYIKSKEAVTTPGNAWKRFSKTRLPGAIT